MITNTRETFDKSERLCSRKIIGSLFENGNIFYTSVFKVVWSKDQPAIPGYAQVAFSVSKRGFRHAVTRNLIKRRLREVYRKNKAPLYNHLADQNIKIVFIVIMRGSTIPDYLTLDKGIRHVISKLITFTSDSENIC